MGIIRFFKRHLPIRLVNELRRRRYAHQIRRGTFISREKEFEFLPKLINEGDTVVDIGANVGHYTALLSKIVGPKGRVFSIEPIPATFAMLAANLFSSGAKNVTLINMAISSTHSPLLFSIPNDNPYLARVTADGTIPVYGAPLIALLGEHEKVSFIKIDAEGYDELIIRSAASIIQRHSPVVMAELNLTSATNLAIEIGNYVAIKIIHSHNSILVPRQLLRSISNSIGIENITTQK